ncbi:unnamed protein product [Schistocephalus solidus]|uniref:Secreted protein n=1 Tax=Schistocephalus solidus TaxID=70667 RepID=A0A183TBM3_SCHSO|nr:unnamed protein product [Schistocephalus solidus]
MIRRTRRTIPLVLLGIRSDHDFFTADFVFGATVLLPGEMISQCPCGAVEDPVNLRHRLRQLCGLPTQFRLAISLQVLYGERPGDLLSRPSPMCSTTLTTGTPLRRPFWIVPRGSITINI